MVGSKGDRQGSSRNISLVPTVSQVLIGAGETKMTKSSRLVDDLVAVLGRSEMVVFSEAGRGLREERSWAA